MRRSLSVIHAIVFLLCSQYALAQDFNDALIHTLSGHSSEVCSVAFSPDGKFIASGSEDKTIKIWDAESEKCVRTLEGHASYVMSVMYSPDGKLLASGSLDGTIKIWDVASGICVRTLEGHKERVSCIAYSPNGKLIASGCADDSIKIWNVATGKCLRTLSGHYNWLRSLAFSPDGKALASGSDDYTVRIWDVTTGKCLRTLNGHSHRVYSVAYSPDGKNIASGSNDNTIKIWNAANGSCLRTLSGHSEEICSVTYSPDGRNIASASYDSTIRIWDVATGNSVRTLKGHSRRVSTVAYSRDGKFIASGSYDNTVKVWCQDVVRAISIYISREVANWSKAEQEKLEAWKQKGEFEKTSDYNQRMKAWPEKVKAFEAALNAQKEEITKEAFRKYMAGYSANVPWSSYAIEKYDTENESFKLSIPVLGDVVLAVPFDKAQAFKSSGNLSFQNQDYALTESGWKLKSMEVVHSTLGTFKYDATKVKGYVAPKPVSLNLNLPSLSLGTKIQLADAPKQVPKEAVDDVDSGLPKSLTKNPNAITIVIGIETYKDIPGVPYAKHDAETFKEYAENVLGVPGDKNHTYLITNEDATKGTFEKVFTGNGWLAKRSIPASDIYIFYAGHGAPDVSSKKAFLIPYDGDANYASQTGFSLDRLYAELKGLNARSVTVFVDACFSGGTRDNQMVLANARPMFVKIDNPVMLSDKLTVFAASSGDQISSGYPDAGHGLFSYCLFKGLKGEADADADGKVTLGELGKYLQTMVSQKAGQLDREQTPELMTTNKDKVLVKYR